MSDLATTISSAQDKPPRNGDFSSMLQSALETSKKESSEKAAEAENFIKTFKNEKAEIDSKEKPEKAEDLLKKVQSWKPEEKPSDPVNAFGSWGAAFAMLAAGFTKQRMV